MRKVHNIRNFLICCRDHCCTTVAVYAARYDIISGNRSIIILYNNTASWLMVSRGSIYNGTALRCSCSLSDIASPPSRHRRHRRRRRRVLFQSRFRFYIIARRFSRVWVFLYINVCAYYTCIYIFVRSTSSRHVCRRSFYGRAEHDFGFPARTYIYICMCMCTVGE